jgi:hypothetical protein
MPDLSAIRVLNFSIGDSGASCHYCNSEEGQFDYTTILEEITVGSSNKMFAKKVGSLRCIVQQKNGEKFVVVLKDVKFVPELWVNLFSISKALKNGFNLGIEDVAMKLMKGNTTLYFNRMLKTKNGFVSGIKLLPILGNNIATTVVEANKVKPKININNLHKIVGHFGEVATRMTGKSFGYDVVGNYMTCEASSVAKARQKNINKDWKGSSFTTGGRLYADISSVKGESYGGSKFWTIVVDDYSRYC